MTYLANRWKTIALVVLAALAIWLVLWLVFFSATSTGGS